MRWATALIVLTFPALLWAEEAAPEHRISAERFRELCREAVEEVLPEGLELDEVRWSQSVRLPRGELDAEAFLEGDEPVRGRLRARVEVLVDGESVRVVRVRLTVRDRRPVVTATTQLRPGDVVGPGDIELRELPPGTYVRRPVRQLEEAVGQVVTRLTGAGEALEATAIRPPALVRRRERVRIVVRTGGVEVTALGEPMEDGALGETIRVVCLASRRTLEARVVGPGVVEVR